MHKNFRSFSFRLEIAIAIFGIGQQHLWKLDAFDLNAQFNLNRITNKISITMHFIWSVSFCHPWNSHRNDGILFEIENKNWCHKIVRVLTIQQKPKYSTEMRCQNANRIWLHRHSNTYSAARQLGTLQSNVYTFSVLQC